jgi:hypothetical protein
MSYFTPPLDFFLQVRKGRIMGHNAFTLVGENAAIGTSWETLWPEGGLANYPTSADTLTISSSSADDTSAGTGLRTVKIEGLDAKFNDISETITLNGQTGVTTANSYYRITFLVGQTAGSAGSNQGMVYIGTGTITTGKPATVYGIINTNCNKSHCGRFTASAGETYHNVYTLLSADAPTLIQQFVRPPGGIWYASGAVVITEATTISTHVAPQLTAGMDYELRAKALSGTTQAYSYSEFIEADIRSG